MKNKELKKLLSEIAVQNGFESAFGGWFRESSECILSLDLQRSNFSRAYYLNIKVYIQKTSGKITSKSKELLKNTGDLSRAQPKEYDSCFDLETALDVNQRKEKLENFFLNYLAPFTKKALTREGLKELVRNKEIAVMYSWVKEELGL